jgi:hypothetical protein
LARSRPDFRGAAKVLLADEQRGVSQTVSALLSRAAGTSASMRVIPIERLVLHPRIEAADGPDSPPIAELMRSVRDLGVLAPILVRQLADDRFEVIDGSRRWQAARAAGHTAVPVIVHDLDDENTARFVESGRHRRPLERGAGRLDGAASQPDRRGGLRLVRAVRARLSDRS